MTTYAVVPDLMDRSKVSAAHPDVVHVPLALAAERATPADTVLVDLGRAAADLLAPLVATGARVIGFASHVDDATLAAATNAGIESLPRSVFFRRLGTDL